MGTVSGVMKSNDAIIMRLPMSDYYAFMLFQMLRSDELNQLQYANLYFRTLLMQYKLS